MGDTRSAGTTGIVTRTDKGLFPLGFVRNTTVNKRITSTEEGGVGDIRTREILPHYIQFNGNLSKALLIAIPLTQIGFEPSVTNFLVFKQPNLYFPDLVTGKMALAIYMLMMTNKTVTIAKMQTLTEAMGFICLNVLDAYELGM